MSSIRSRIVSFVVASLLRSALIAVSLAAASALLPLGAAAQTVPAKPTIVLVHGAFAESSSWDAVTTRLLAKGYPVIAVANPLRGLKSDAAYVAGIVDAVPGQVVLVGHSYGGSVISNVSAARGNVKALVFVAGFAPEVGESAGALAGRFRGSTLGTALAPAVPLAAGGKDLYIRTERFRDQFAADVPANEAALMAVDQRPITAAAIDEAAGRPAWKTIPSWFIYGSLDRNIPPAAQAFMAQRAGARKTVVVDGGSHVVMVSRPEKVASLIGEAAAFATQP